MALIEGHGLRPGTRFWRGPDKFDYHVNRQMAGGRVSMRCTEYYMEKCKGRASVDPGRGFPRRFEPTGFRRTQPHNHDPVKFKVESRAFRHALMERCRNGDHTPFKRMYHEERRKLRISRHAAAVIPQVTLKSSMRRARLENRPHLPQSIKDLDKVLRQRRYKALSRTLDGEDNVYLGRAGSASSKTISVLFASKRRLKYLKKVKKIFCDATFSVVPRGMKASQVWTISTIRLHHVIPLVRVLMRRRTTATYEAALAKLKEAAPRFNPLEIMSDFEGAEQRALANAFPDADQHGCLFHYAKDVGGNARKLKMAPVIKENKTVRSLVREISVLPLLPTNKIKEGFKYICKRTCKKRVAREMLPLLTYWVRTWWPKRHVLSVCGSQDRTNNGSESDNKMFQDAVRQTRPNVWDFMDGVLDMEDSSEQDLYALRKGRNPSRRRKVSAVANDTRIENLTSDLVAGTRSVRSFLKEASFTIIEALNRGLEGRKKKKQT